MISIKLYLGIIRVAGELLSAEKLRDLLAEGVGVVLPPVELGRSEGRVAEGDDVVEEEAVRHLGLAHGLNAFGGSEDGTALQLGFVSYLTVQVLNHCKWTFSLTPLCHVHDHVACHCTLISMCGVEPSS